MVDNEFDLIGFIELLIMYAFFFELIQNSYLIIDEIVYMNLGVVL